MNTTVSRSERPFLPSDLDPARSLCRACVAELMHSIRPLHQPSAESFVARHWPRDPLARAITRAASAPPMGTGSTANALQPSSVAAFVAGLILQSSAAQLMARGIRLDLTGNQSVEIPHLGATAPLPIFVSEGGPIPVAQAALAAGTLGPVRKLALITAFTNEIAEHSIPDVETVVTTVLQEAATKSLDQAVFSTSASDAVRMGGILAGVTPIAATAGGGLQAAEGDIKNLINAITQNGGGRRIMLFTQPGRAASLAMLAPGFSGLDNIEVVPAVTLAADSIVAVDPVAFASGFGPDPLIETATSSLLHFEDTSPQQIGTVGTPNVVAAPTRSMFQTDSFGLRLILRCAWVMRAPGLVQVINTVSW
jgi:hypothetical protein